MFEPVVVWNWERLVQAIESPESFPGLGSHLGIKVGLDGDGGARSQIDHQKRDNGDPEEEGDHIEQSLDNILKHQDVNS